MKFKVGDIIAYDSIWAGMSTDYYKILKIDAAKYYVNPAGDYFNVSDERVLKLASIEEIVARKLAGDNIEVNFKADE